MLDKTMMKIPAKDLPEVYTFMCWIRVTRRRALLVSPYSIGIYSVIARIDEWSWLEELSRCLDNEMRRFSVEREQ